MEDEFLGDPPLACSSFSDDPPVPRSSFSDNPPTGSFLFEDLPAASSSLLEDPLTVDGGQNPFDLNYFYQERRPRKVCFESLCTPAKPDQ